MAANREIAPASSQYTIEQKNANIMVVGILQNLSSFTFVLICVTLPQYCILVSIFLSLISAHSKTPSPYLHSISFYMRQYAGSRKLLKRIKKA